MTTSENTSASGADKTYDIYGMGNALLDMEFEIGEDFFSTNQIEKGVMTLVDEDRQNTLVQALGKSPVKKQCGGSAANTIVAASQLGATCFYACKVADDEEGEFYLRDLHGNRVDTTLSVEQLPTGKTGKCLVMITPDTDRTMNTFLGITSGFSESEVNYEALKNSKYLYIEGYLVASDLAFQAALKARDFAKKNGVKIALTFSDPSIMEIFRERFVELVGDGLDFIFCNESEAMKFTQKETVKEAAEALVGLASQFTITVGIDGAHAYDGNQFYDIPSYPTKAVDSNGAGDNYAGAFLFGITQDMGVRASGHLASMVASEVVSYFGPRLDHDHVVKVYDKFKKEFLS